MVRRLALAPTLALILGLAPAPEASACPNCKDAMSEQPSDAPRWAEGFGWSIILMLAVPASLATVGGLAVRRAVKLGVLPEM